MSSTTKALRPLTDLEVRAAKAMKQMHEDGPIKNFTYFPVDQCFHVHLVTEEKDQKRVIGINRLIALYEKWQDGTLVDLD